MLEGMPGRPGKVGVLLGSSGAATGERISPLPESTSCADDPDAPPADPPGETDKSVADNS